MLSGKGNAGERWKTTIGLISKKATLHVQHTFFFCTFLWCCFARLQRETSRNFLVTSFLEEMSYVSRSLFFTAAHFQLHWWPLAFLLLSPPLQYFHVVIPQKNVSRGACSEVWNRVYMIAPVKKFGRVKLSTNFPWKQIWRRMEKWKDDEFLLGFKFSRVQISREGFYELF